MTAAKNKAAVQKEEKVVVEIEEVKEPKVDLTDYMSFAEAAKSLGVRFQQVYQRAVVRSKMHWVDGGKRKMVLKADVAEWAVIREQYFAAKSK